MKIQWIRCPVRRRGAICRLDWGFRPRCRYSGVISSHPGKVARIGLSRPGVNGVTPRASTCPVWLLNPLASAPHDAKPEETRTQYQHTSRLRGSCDWTADQCKRRRDRAGVSRG